MTEAPRLAGQDWYESVWTTTPDGLRLHARLYGTLNGRLPVVCLPGLTRNASEFHRLALALQRAGTVERLVAVDYRGRGLSDWDPDASRYTIPVEAGDLLRILDELGIAEAVFIGVSRGGLIAMGLAGARPGLIRGLVLNDIGPVLERAGLLRIKGYVGRLGQPTDFDDAARRLQALFGSQFPRLRPEEWRDWAETVWAERDGALALAYDPALAGALEGVSEASPIEPLWSAFDALKEVPVLVIRGARSDLLSADTVAEMAARHPRLEAIEVEDEGHTPFMHRPALVARIASFVAAIEAGEGRSAVSLARAG